MPIRFRCSQCNIRLRVPDGTHGREVKCPQCGSMEIIPGTDQIAAAAGQSGRAGLSGLSGLAGLTGLAGRGGRKDDLPIGTPARAAAQAASRTAADTATDTDTDTDTDEGDSSDDTKLGVPQALEALSIDKAAGDAPGSNTGTRRVPPSIDPVSIAVPGREAADGDSHADDPREGESPAEAAARRLKNELAAAQAFARMSEMIGKDGTSTDDHKQSQGAGGISSTQKAGHAHDLDNRDDPGFEPSPTFGNWAQAMDDAVATPLDTEEADETDADNDKAPQAPSPRPQPQPQAQSQPQARIPQSAPKPGPRAIPLSARPSAHRPIGQPIPSQQDPDEAPARKTRYLSLLVLGRVMRILALVAIPATVKAALTVHRLGYDLWALLGTIFVGVVVVFVALSVGEIALTLRQIARPGAPAGR